MKRWLPLALVVAVLSCAPNEDEIELDEQEMPELTRIPGDTTGMVDPTVAQMEIMMRDSILRMDSTGGMRGAHTMAPAKDADQLFLRMMSDHHEGLVQMALQAMQREPVNADAEALYEEHVAERDAMVAILERQYDDEEHVPTTTGLHRSQLDSLAAAPAERHDRTFYRMVIDHHRQAMIMIDHLLPRMQNAEVKQMAEGMKSELQRDVEVLQQKMSRG